MKKRISMILIMTLLLGVSSNTVEVKSASDNVSKAKAAYKEMIMDSYNDATPIQFCVIDINEDGIPELIKKYDINYTNIYTYHKGEVVVLDYFFGCHYLKGYYKNKNIYIHNFASQGDWYYYESINGAKVKSETMYGDSGNGDSMVYEINGSKTTKSKFEKYINSLGKLHKFQYSEVNSTNIKKYLSNTQKLTLVKGSTNKLILNKQNADKVTWTSNNKSVVTVDKNGEVTAKKNGKATVTATVKYPAYTEKYKFEVDITSAKQKALSTYASILSKEESDSEFVIKDMNGNGIPELITRDGWNNTVYELKNGKIKTIAELSGNGSGSLHYKENGKYLVLSYAEDVGDYYYDVYQVKKEEIKLLGTLLGQTIFDNNFNVIGHRYLGWKNSDSTGITELTTAQGDKLVNKYVGNLFNWHINTKANRVKYLK